MKKIIEQALRNQPKKIRADCEAVKLRLRGRGSGFLEGPDKKGIFINFFKFINI